MKHNEKITTRTLDTTIGAGLACTVLFEFLPAQCKARGGPCERPAIRASASVLTVKVGGADIGDELSARCLIELEERCLREMGVNT